MRTVHTRASRPFSADLSQWHSNRQKRCIALRLSPRVLFLSTNGSDKPERCMTALSGVKHTEPLYPLVLRSHRTMSVHLPLAEPGIVAVQKRQNTHTPTPSHSNCVYMPPGASTIKKEGRATAALRVRSVRQLRRN